jgi:hypothetical protein
VFCFLPSDEVKTMIASISYIAPPFDMGPARAAGMLTRTMAAVLLVHLELGLLLLRLGGSRT